MRRTDSQKDQQAEREALRQRIDAELAEMGPIPLSSWMMAEPPAAAALEDGRVPATEVELDAALVGSALLAGMVHGLLSGYSPEQTLRTATAIAAMAVTQIGFGISDAAHLATLESGVRVRPLTEE